MNKKKSLMILLLLVLAPLLGLIQIPAVGASPGWLPGWDKRMKFTIDSGDIDDTLTNFPLLIYLGTSAGENSEDVTFVFDEIGANRKKIAVTTSDGESQCYVEIEKWDSVGEKAWLWVKVPTIASGADTDLYLYYDNAHADNDAYVGDTNSVVAENVWDNNFVMVHHMADDTTSTILDSTQYDSDGAKKGANEPIETADGQIGPAQVFDGDDDYIDEGTDAIFDFVNAITIETWLRPEEVVDWERIVVKAFGGTSTADACYEFSIRIDNEWRWAVGGVFDDSPADPVPVEGQWDYIVTTYDRVNAEMYVAGAEISSTAHNGAIRVNVDTSLTIGAVHWGEIFFFPYNGTMDEVRISKISRSAAWVKASYESGRDHLNDFGIEEAEAEYEKTAPGAGVVIDTTTAESGVGGVVLRKTFYANGRYWTFYLNGTHLLLKTSINSFEWSSPTVIRTGIHGTDCSVYFDGTYFHYAYSNASLGHDIFCRRGLPNSDGSVTWSAAEQTAVVIPGDEKAFRASIAVDSNGYVWIFYRHVDNGNVYEPYVTKSGNNDGTWGATPGGFPYNLKPGVDKNWSGEVIPLTAGKVLVIYARDIARIYSRSWDGAAWNAEKWTTSDMGTTPFLFSAVGQGDYVHIVYSQRTTTDMVYEFYNYTSNSWGGADIVQAAAGLTGPALSIDEANDLICIWGNITTDCMYYKRQIEGVWDATPTLSANESVDQLLGRHKHTCFDQYYGDKIGLLYMTKTESPYNVKYASGETISVTITNLETCGAQDWIFQGRTQYYVQVIALSTQGTDISAGFGFYDDAGVWYSVWYNNATETITLVAPNDGVSVELTGTSVSDGLLYFNVTIRFNTDIADSVDVDLYGRVVEPLRGDSGWIVHRADYFNIYNLGGYVTLEASGWAGRTPGGDVFEIFAADTRTKNLLPLESFDVDDKPLPAGTKVDWWGFVPVGTSIVPADEGPLLDLLIGWDFWMSQRLPNQTIMVTNRLPSGSGGDADAYYSYPFGLRTLARPTTSNGLMAEKEFLRQVTPAYDEIVYVQIYAMTPQTTNTTGKILITDDGYVDDLKAHAALDSLQVVDLVFSGNGSIRLTDGVAGYIYPATYTGLTWYNFTFEINCTAQNYDMYVDGVLNATDVDFRQKVAGADTVGHITIMDISMAGSYTDIYVDDIKAWTDFDGDYGGDAKATALFRYLQHWSMDWDFKIEEGREYTKGPTSTPWDPTDDYSNHGYIELGWDVCIDEVWENNFLVARINITDGKVLEKSNWVQYNVTWTQNGTYVNHDIIYGYFEGYKLEAQPGDVKDTTGWYWDMWFNRMNASTVIGGRLNTEYFGMTNQPTFSWGSNWKPVYSEFTESSCFVDLLDSNGTLHSAKEVSLVRAWVHVFRTNQSTFHYAIANTETEFPTAEDTMSGIDTPPLQETIAPQGASLGGLGPYLASALNRIMAGLGDSIFGGLLVVAGNIQRTMTTLIGGLALSLFTGFSAILGALIAFVDDIAAAAGLPENLMSTMVGIVTSTMGFMVTMIAEGYMFDMLTNIFTFITSTFGHILFWLTSVITTFTDIFTIVWSLIDGTYTGAGVLVDLWATFNWAEWSDAVPLFIIIAWFDSLDSRWRAAGKQGWVGYLFADLGMVKTFAMLLLDVGTWVIEKSVVLFERIVNLIPW